MKKLSNIEKHKQFLPFDKAREFVRSLGLKDYPKWYAYCKSGNRPDNIPAYPEGTYKKEWKGMPDFLGTGRISNRDRQFHSFEDAREIVRKLKIKNQREWQEYSKSGNRLDNIPSLPRRTYKKEWKGWGDFLGTGTIAPQNMSYNSFDEAKKSVQSLKLKNRNEWTDYCKSGKKPNDIPMDPRQVYKKDWIGWGDWLGTGRVANQNISQNWLPWKEAKTLYQKIAKENKITTTSHWYDYVKKHKLPKGLPPYPTDIYTKERVGKMKE